MWFRRHVYRGLWRSEDLLKSAGDNLQNGGNYIYNGKMQKPNCKGLPDEQFPSQREVLLEAVPACVVQYEEGKLGFILCSDAIRSEPLRPGV